jgi:hypothetical protein
MTSHDGTSVFVLDAIAFNDAISTVTGTEPQVQAGTLRFKISCCGLGETFACQS